MKKVLIIGPEFYDYNLSAAGAFTNLGFETSVLGYSAGTVTSFAERIQYHLAKDKRKFFEENERRFNEKVLAEFNHFNPDLIFIIHGGVLHADTMAKMKSCKRVLWMMDSLARGNVISEFIKQIDYVFFFEKTDIDFLRERAGIKSWFLPLALDPKVYFPEKSEQEIDILFVGALYENRMEMLGRIAEEFKDKQIKVYGNYYSPLRRPLHHLFRKNKNVFLNKNISPAKVNQLYNHSKLCLNIHHAQSKFGVNQRFFEISGSKAFQLVDKKGYIEENFTAEEIMTYSSEAEMMEKIHYAFNNFPQTQEMAAKAYEKVVSEHTFTHRIKYVLDIIQA